MMNLYLAVLYLVATIVMIFCAIFSNPLAWIGVAIFPFFSVMYFSYFREDLNK